MAEAKPRPSSSFRRPTRPRTDDDVDGGDNDLDQTPPPEEPIAVMPEDRRRDYDEQEEYAGFDEEVNNRYEEIKRGSTHISELQQMTMPQLLKIAREEGLTEVTGLKKQDPILRISTE